LQEKLDNEVLKTRLVLSNDYEGLSIREVKSLDILAFVFVSLLTQTEPLVFLSAKTESCHVTVVSLSTWAEPCYVMVGSTCDICDFSCGLEIAVLC
jgi:hypothetical protein